MLWMDCSHIRKCCCHLFLAFLILLFYNEFVIYYATLLKCSWPNLNPTGYQSQASPLRAMILADTHLLGPFKGHPWDKLRREWQMERSFQSALTLFDPEAIFLLGDVFDEGHWVDEKGWQEYLRRFRSIFRRDSSVPLVVVPGNHDIGFHYHLISHPSLGPRFKDVYDTKGKQVSAITLKDVNFVLMNSIAFEGDKCRLCSSAVQEIHALSKDLRCARNKTADCPLRASSSSSTSSSPPVLLQHFPLYRESDAFCSEPDEASPHEKAVPFKEKWDCVSKESTKQILKLLEPRLVISGHTHSGCLTLHPSSSTRRVGDGKKVPEYSVSSFSWRNRNNPTFILATLTSANYAISKCYLPEESTVINNYICGSIFSLLYFVFPWRRCFGFWVDLVRCRGKSKIPSGQIPSNDKKL